MAKTVVLDELHVTFRRPKEMSDMQTEEIRRTLNGEEFMNRLRRAIRSAMGAFPELRVVRISLTR